MHLSKRNAKQEAHGRDERAQAPLCARHRARVAVDDDVGAALAEHAHGGDVKVGGGVDRDVADDVVLGGGLSN